MEDKQYKIIFNAGVSRHLLHAGCPIADIKADRDNKDRTLFVFERTAKFEEEFAKINTGIQEKKELETQ